MTGNEARTEPQISIATDYVAGKGDPEPYLQLIAEAGFTHVHWCHEWCTDHVYSSSEIRQAGDWMRQYGLQVLDLHGSVGPEKDWASGCEDKRKAGAALVLNRMQMTSALGGQVVVMHIPAEPGSDALRKSLDELATHAEANRVRIALENGNFEAIRPVLSEYGDDYLGLCYDSGHGNMDGDGLDNLEPLKDRLVAIHLHDNDGASDQHNPLYSGSVDWERLANVLAVSSYAGCISMELTIHHSGMDDEVEFLRYAHQTGARFREMVECQRKVP